MELRDFTPAQTLMLTRPFLTTGTELIKYSFLDLVYRGILKVYKDWRLPHPRQTRERFYTFVSRGELFTNYIHSYHQHPFVAPFLEDDYEYQVKILAKKVYTDSGEGFGFKSRKVYPQLKEQGYFTTSLGLKYLNLFFVSNKGAKLRRKFKRILNEADESLPKFAQNNTERAKEILSTLGSNVILLDCFNDQLIDQLRPIFNDLGKTDVSFSEGAFGDHEGMVELMFYSFLETMDYFDSSFDLFDSTFDFGSSDFGGDIGGGDFGGGDFGGGDY
ncbi:hypothetical protein [Persicobacter diffluens]|uniref:Uncharacterized protein n=1 Tax=Persicobacter diffluens TaxID=981 RepID=A0AAN4VZZ1_9BACT|nr:hypothetical protein PEDI_19670 [Persicobacter diffluens]